MEITLTRALAELKLLDSRINKEIHEASMIAVTTGKKTVPGYSSSDDFKDKTKSTYQSIRDLIKRRSEIKSAIVKSNAENTVTIGEKQYSVAEAIERKNGIQYEQTLLNKMKSDYAKQFVNLNKKKKRLKIILMNI